MCPDRQIISLYLDGELPSPWKEKMKTHLASCPKCRSAFAGYGKLRENLGDLSKDSIQAAQDRVWKNICASELGAGEWNLKPSGRIYQDNKEWSWAAIKYRPGRVWNRTVSLPLPAAAAAAVIIMIGFFAILGLKNKTPSVPVSMDTVTAMNIGLDDQGIVPVTDMNGVLRYLSSQDNGDFMVIRLPETKNFSRIGEPTLINAADYSRRQGSR